MNTNRFSPLVEEVLREAGWHPNRQLSLEELEPWLAFKLEAAYDICRIFPAALKVMREFGGLSVHQGSQPGITCRRQDFCLDPLPALPYLQEGSWFNHEWALETKLYPLGLINKQHDVLAMSQQGRVYIFSVGEALVADTFDEALENLIHGVNIQSMKDFLYNPDKLEESRAVERAVHKTFLFIQNVSTKSNKWGAGSGSM